VGAPPHAAAFTPFTSKLRVARGNQSCPVAASVLAGPGCGRGARSKRAVDPPRARRAVDPLLRAAPTAAPTAALEQANPLFVTVTCCSAGNPTPADGRRRCLLGRGLAWNGGSADKRGLGAAGGAPKPNTEQEERARAGGGLGAAWSAAVAAMAMSWAWARAGARGEGGARGRGASRGARARARASRGQGIGNCCGCPAAVLGCASRAAAPRRRGPRHSQWRARPAAAGQCCRAVLLRRGWE
jgi:hypothetical protein